MSMTITIELDDVAEKCLRYIASDPQEWIQNFVDARVFAAKHEIYENEIRRMTADPTVKSIPADIDVVVQQANVVFANAQPTIPVMNPLFQQE